jgi:hypothetical protein
MAAVADAANVIQLLALRTRGTLKLKPPGQLSMQHFISQDIGERHWE